MKKLILSCALGLMSYPVFAQVEAISTDSLRILSSNPENPLNGGGLDSNSTDTVGRKIVFWIHGLAGNQSSWGHVYHATRFQGGNPIPGYPERVFYGINQEYTAEEQFDLLNATINYAQILKNKLNSSPYPGIDTSKRFAIAHSQGGLMGRTLRYMSKSTHPNAHVPNLFTGLATFGTPHQGAAIINYSDSGHVQNWITEGCIALSKAEITIFTDGNWILSNVLPPSLISRFSTAACSGLEKTVLPLLVNSIRTPLSKDYAKGHPILDSLNQFASTDPLFQVVTFYGAEEEPVFWRLIHTMTLTPDSVITGETLKDNPFGLDDDDELPMLVNNRISDYISKKNYWIQRSRRVVFYTWLRPPSHYDAFSLFSYNRAIGKARIYNSAAHWLGSANLRWKRYIGARRDSVWLEGYQCDCLYDLGGMNGYSFSSTVVQDPSDCNTSNAISCNITPRERHMIYEEESDGVVPISSQRTYYGAKNASVELENTNHMQVRNCTRTKEELTKLFDGTYGIKFKLDKK